MHLRSWLATVEPFGKGDALLIIITQRFVKGVNLRVIGTNHQLQLGDAARAEPILSGVHDVAAIALEAVIGIDSDVIDPATVTVMSDEHRSHQRVLTAAEQDG